MSSPTPTPTPTTTPILCGSGITTGNFYYTDCCGYFQEGNSSEQLVILNYSLPYAGVQILNTPASTLCPTPTNTATPTVTPTNSATNTPTPTITPTSTHTPTVTPTPSRAVTFVTKNDCDVITLFPLGVECSGINPSGPDTLDGKLFLKITGGTAPYNITWEGGQKTPYLFNLGGGFYNVTVVDYWGDYTAITNCELIAPSPTPTNTATPTLTPTPSPNFSGLCFSIVWSDGTTEQLEFSFNGYLNGYPRWFDSTNGYYVQWSPVQGWRVSGYTYQGAILASNTTAIVPTSGWFSIAGTYTATVSVNLGACQPFNNLYFTTQTAPATCESTCNGSVIITPFGGVPPYQYSIDNGVTYQNGNIFSSICGGNYPITILDSTGNTYTQQVTIPNAGTTTNYSVGLQVVSLNTAGITKQQQWRVVVSPALPAGVTLSYNLNIFIDQLEQRPGGGIIDYATVVRKNGVAQFTTATTTTSLQPRPFCSPQTQTETDFTEIFPLTMTSGDIISGTSISQISLDNPANINGCSTLLTQNMTVSLTNVSVSGCNCCSASFNQSTATFSHAVGV